MYKTAPDNPPFPFIGYPTNNVFAVLGSPEQVRDALKDLEAAGVAPDAITIFCRAEGVTRVDSSGDGRKPSVRPVTLTDGGRRLRPYEQRLKAGHYIMRVPIRSVKQKTLIRIALRTNGGQFTNCYEPWARCSEAASPAQTERKNRLVAGVKSKKPTLSRFTQQ